ncbi:hypothetical protein HMPREF9441_03241, partial [Paraprevotella clara YIT 11840]
MFIPDVVCSFDCHVCFGYDKFIFYWFISRRIRVSCGTSADIT